MNITCSGKVIDAAEFAKSLKAGGLVRCAIGGIALAAGVVQIVKGVYNYGQADAIETSIPTMDEHTKLLDGLEEKLSKLEKTDPETFEKLRNI